MPKERLDILVQRQLGVSRSKAQGLIHLGQVFDSAGEKLDKPGLRLEPDTPLVVRDEARYVSRGGEKLEAGLRAFSPSLEGRICLDVGASTGGFTDCLLQHGAARVYAVDVGYGQLAWSLRQDPRVVVLERCNIRHLTPDKLDIPPTFFTADCSFISLTKVLPAVLPLLGPDPAGIVLIKPQFEAGKSQVGKGGVVRDTAIHDAVIERIRRYCQELGFQHFEVIPSPLLGPAGNREFLAYLNMYRPVASDTGVPTSNSS